MAALPGYPAWPGSSPGTHRPQAVPEAVVGHVLSSSVMSWIALRDWPRLCQWSAHRWLSSLCLLMGRSGVPGSGGQSCSHWRGLVRRRALELHHSPAVLPALPACWLTWRRAALPCPVCPAGLPEQPGRAVGASRHCSNSGFSAQSWAVCTPCKITAESVTSGEFRWFSPWWFSL